MSERKALLILHGKQALNEEVRTAVEEKREQGWELAVRLTWEAGDAQRMSARGTGGGLYPIDCRGGDGTLRDIAEALAAQADQASLVLLPLGTANDFARAAGVSWYRERHSRCWTCRRNRSTWGKWVARCFSIWRRADLAAR